MRALDAVLIVLLLAADALWRVWLIASGRSAPAGPPVWTAVDRTIGDRTVVAVSLQASVGEGSTQVLEEREVGSVPNAAPDYDRIFREIAPERAVLLNMSRG